MFWFESNSVVNRSNLVSYLHWMLVPSAVKERIFLQCTLCYTPFSGSYSTMLNRTSLGEAKTAPSMSLKKRKNMITLSKTHEKILGPHSMRPESRLPRKHQWSLAHEQRHNVTKLAQTESIRVCKVNLNIVILTGKMEKLARALRMMVWRQKLWYRRWTR